MCVPYIRNLIKSIDTMSTLKMRIVCFTSDVRLHPGVSQWLFNRDMMAHTKR